MKDDSKGHQSASADGGATTEEALSTVETLMAYPYGRLKDPGSLPSTRLAGQGPLLRRRWRIAIAVESAGLMLSEFTRFLRGLPIDHDLSLNLLAGEMSCAQPR